MASQNKNDQASQDSSTPSSVSRFPGAKAKGADRQQAKSARSIKNPLLYAGTVAILVITIVAFVIAPALGGGGSQGSALSFGSWNGTKITYTQGSYFASQVARINDYLRQQGLDERNFQLYAQQVWRMAFESAAVRTAVLDTVRRSGFRVSEKGIDTEVAKNEAFQDAGQFSPEKYKAASMATKLSLRDTARDDLAMTRYYEDVYSLAPSTAETAFVAEMARPRRQISYVAFPLERYADAELDTWAKANAGLFRKAGVSRITVTSSQSDAEKILKQVRENKLAFEDAAKSHSKDAYADRGGDAGSVFFHQFSADFKDKAEAEKIFSLPKGELSGVTKLGDKVWAFYRINSAAAEADLSKDESRTEVRDYLYTTERGTLETWALARAKSFSEAAASGFDKAARGAGLSPKSAGPFLVNTGNPSFVAYGQAIPLFDAFDASKTPELAAAANDEAFVTEAFSLPKGKVSKPLVLGDNVIVFQVTGDEPARDDGLAMVKFAFPYFQQQTVDTSIRNGFLTSKKFKDGFNETFYRVFQASNAQASNTQAGAAGSAQPAAADTATTTTVAPQK